MEAILYIVGFLLSVEIVAFLRVLKWIISNLIYFTPELIAYQKTKEECCECSIDVSSP